MKRREVPPASGLVESGLYEDATWIWRRSQAAVESRAPHTSPDFTYDLASLTKPFLATTALWCVSRGLLDLQELVFPEQLNRPPRLEDLLRHLGGSIAWWPLYLDGRSGGRIPTAPELWPGTPGVYSDVGYLTAARWIEHRTQRSLLGLIQRFVAEELGEIVLDREPFPAIRHMHQAEATDVTSRPSPCSTAKEVDLARGLGLAIDDLGPPAHGEPQDGNARWLARRGVFAGHAGLFGTARAVDALMERWLRAARRVGSQPLDKALRDALEPRQGRLLGWQTPPDDWQLPATVFGHFGFTGGSIWADPAVDSSMVLLAHRSDPSSDLGVSRRAVSKRWHRWARSSEPPPESLQIDW